MPEFWPANLPACLTFDSLSVGPGDGRIRSQTDTGPQKVRLRSSAMPGALSGTVPMTYDQLATLETFVKTTTLGGSLPFMFPSQRGGDILVRFADSLPTWQRLGAGKVLVNLSLETLPGALPAYLTAGRGWALKAQGEYADLDFDFTGQRYLISDALYATYAEAGITCVRNSVAYAQTVAGTWTSFAVNVPRITDRGLLVEEQRTNLYINSGVPITRTVTVVNGTVYTVSLVGSGSLALTGAGTGTVTEAAPVTFTASTTSLTVTPSGVSGSFVNVNVEAGGFATSPIVTAGTAVTRAADAITRPLGLEYNQTQGTVVAAFLLGRDLTANTWWQLDDGTNNNSIRGRDGGGGGWQGVALVGGVAQTNLAGYAAPGTANTLHKVALAYKLNDFAQSTDGGAVQVDTSATLPTVGTLRLGSNATGEYVNSYIRRFSYFASRLPNTDLIGLST